MFWEKNFPSSLGLLKFSNCKQTNSEFFLIEDIGVCGMYAFLSGKFAKLLFLLTVVLLGGMYAFLGGKFGKLVNNFLVPPSAIYAKPRATG